MKKSPSFNEPLGPGTLVKAEPLIRWNPAFSTGLEKVDEQHKRLISLLNYMNDAVRKGEQKNVLGKALIVLAGYVAYHFATEETMLRQYGSYEVIGQKSHHDDLTRYIQGVRKEVDAGDIVIDQEVMNSLKAELINHLLNIVKKFEDFVDKCPASP
jgi:hemerythrin-like metal-binding protein